MQCPISASASSKSPRYVVAQYDRLEDLIPVVNDYLEKGWKPLGGISVVIISSREHEGTAYYTQAMTLG